MPFYEYQCSSCNHHIEVLQKISDKPLRKCPDCGKSALKRLISAPVFRLKGGGWYETDFKSDNEQKRNLAGKEEAAESKSEETKPDTSKDTKSADSKPAEAKPSEKPAPVKAASVSRKAKPVAKAKPKAKPAAKKKRR